MIWNSGYYWGVPAKILHWVAAILVVVIYVDGILWLDDWDERGASGRGAVAWHAAAGITLAVVMLGRLLWRFANKTPMMPASTPKWETFAAHSAHAALYVVTLLVTLTGWALTGGLKPPVEPLLFWLLPLPASALGPMKLVGKLHEVLAHLLMLLAGVHVLAALWHHFVKGDSVLRRMLLRGRNRRR
jgi:cytochrome b561